MHEEPRDPFADDPEHMDRSMVFEPELDDADRADLLEDLHELEMFEKVLEPEGFRGVVVDCADCDEPHYFTWGLLMSNLRALLNDNSAQVHEPAFDPDPSHYVTWDYARGFSDCWLRRHSANLWLASFAKSASRRPGNLAIAGKPSGARRRRRLVWGRDRPVR